MPKFKVDFRFDKFEDSKEDKQMELFDEEKSELYLPELFPNYDKFIRDMIIVQPMPDRELPVMKRKRDK